MDIEEFFDQPYTDRQLVKFVDDSKSEKKSLLVAILEDDKLFDASAAGIVGATRWISAPIGLAASGIEKLSNKSEPDSPKSESENMLQSSSLKKTRERLLTSLKEGKSDRKPHQKYQKKGIVINLIGRSYIEHFKLPPTHPRPQTIYVAHPIFRQEYNPLAEFHRSTFENKFNELLRLLTHLGAKTIEVYHMRGWGAEFAAHLGVHLSTSNKAKVGTQRHSEQTLLYKAVLQGHTPSMPEGLKWYYTEPNWQQIVDQRLHHGLQLFSLHHTYTDDFGINIELGSKLKKAGFDFGGKFEGYTETIWHITGEFLSHDEKETGDE
jgi:hypothetical protein